MTPSWTGKKRRVWIVLSCAVGAACVVALGAPEAVRFVRERRAILAIGSKVAKERLAALEELASIGSSRALRGILSSLEMPPPREEGVFIEEPSSEIYSIEFGTDSTSWPWDLHCAVAIYHGLGKNALPRLRSALGSREPHERYWALRFLWRIPELASEGPGRELLGLLDDPDPRVRSEAVMAVAMSVEMMPFLLDRLTHDLGSAHASGHQRAGAARAVSLAALRESERHGAGLFTTRSAVTALLAAAGDGVTAVRAECARGLCAIQERLCHRDRVLAREVQQFLATRLSEPDLEIRSVLADQLRQPVAIPALIRVLEKGPPGARPGAADVLRSIDGDAVWLAASALLERGDDSISELTEGLLSSLSQKGEVNIGLDLLVQGLFSERMGVRRAAVKILGRRDWIDGRGLLPLLGHEDEVVRLQAAKALSWSVNIDAGALEQTVLELLAEARTDLLRRTACETAPSLGPAAEKAVPLLASLIEAEPWDGQPSAAEALGDIGPGASAAVPTLAAAIRRSDEDLAAAAIRALSLVSPDGCAEAIAGGLRHGSHRVRDGALGALWSLEFRAAPALPALRLVAMDESFPELARRAAELVSRLEAAEPALPSR